MSYCVSIIAFFIAVGHDNAYVDAEAIRDRMPVEELGSDCEWFYENDLHSGALFVVHKSTN